MTAVPVTGVVSMGLGRKDSRPWKAWSPVYRQGSAGEVITTRGKEFPVRVVAGVFSAQLEPGVCVIENPDGGQYTVTVPALGGDLWDIIDDAVAFPPDTAAEALASAVTGYLDDNPVVSMQVAGLTDAGTPGKNALLAATQADARAALGAGTSSLAIGTTGSTAKAGNWVPAAADISNSTAEGRAVLTGDAAAGRTALGATTAAAALEQTVEYAVAKLPAGHYTPTGKPDGAITEFDTGETVYTFGGSVGGVVSGEIVHTPTGAPSATYYEVNAGARVRRVTCEVKWAPGALGGLCIALPILPWGPPGGHPSGTTAAQEDAGIHLVLYANGSWHCSRWESSTATETKYAESTNLGEFTDSDDGEFHTVDVWIDVEASSMTVQFPDGSFKAFSNAAIAADTSSWVVWEQYNFTGASETGVVLRNLSFDTESRRRESFAATKVDIAEAMLAINTGYGLEYVTTSGGSKTMTKFSPQIQVPTGSAAHTIVLPTTDVPKGYEVIIVNTSTGVITVNSSNGSFVTAISSGTEGRFRAFADNPTTTGNWGATLVATTNTTQTFSGKRIDPRVTSTASASSLAPSYSTADIYVYTALAANLTINAPSGTTNGGRLRFRFKDDGVSRTLTWNAIYRGIGVTLPAATTAGKWMYVDMNYNSADTKWDVTDVKIEA